MAPPAIKQALADPLLVAPRDDAEAGDDAPSAGTSFFLRWEALSEHQQGLLYMGTGVAVMIPDGTLVKLIRAPAEAVAVCRLFLTGVVLLLILLARYGRNLPGKVVGLGPWGFAVSILIGGSNTLFIQAVKMTSVANVMLILSTGSFWAALLSRVVLGDRIPTKTWLAMPVVLAGAGVALGAGVAGGGNLGDLVALAQTLLGACRRTIMRHHAHIDMLPAAMLGCFLFSFVWLVLSGGSVRLYPGDVPPVLTLGLVIMPTALKFTTLGSSMLPSAESSLLVCIEIVCSPVMAAQVAGDQVSTQAWIGLAIVVAALIGHAAWPDRSSAAPKA